jgi:hypothetical protein
MSRCAAISLVLPVGQRTMIAEKIANLPLGANQLRWVLEFQDLHKRTFPKLMNTTHLASSRARAINKYASGQVEQDGKS